MAIDFAADRLDVLENADPKALKVFYDALKYDQSRADRLLRDNRKLENAARMLAERTNTATAREFYREFQKTYGMRAQIDRIEDRAAKYAKEVGKLETSRNKLLREREQLGKLTQTEEELLASAELQKNPMKWFRDSFGINPTLGEKKAPSKFVGDKSPGMYRALQIASGQSDGYFADKFNDMGVDVDELYKLYRTNRDGYETRIEEIAEEANKRYSEDLKDFASSQDRQFSHDVITTYFNTAMKSYINSEVLTDAIDNELSALNDTISYFGDGGALADYASVEVMTEGYNTMLKGMAAIHFDGDVEAARAFVDGSLFKEGLPSTDTMDKAQALSSVDSSLLENASDMTEEERSLMLSRMVNQAVGSRTDPGAAMIGQLFKDLDTFNENSAFKMWRRANGIVSTAPPGLAEFQRYNRQVKRTGSGLYRAKRTGDVREVTVVDERYAIPTRTGVMSFAADTEDGSKKYLTGQELEAMSAEQLTSDETRYVEVDLTEDQVRERIFAAIVNPENNPDMREELQKFGRTEGFKSRARMVYDKKEGKFVILDDNLAVVYSGGVENPSALLIDVNDSRFAEPAGSAKGFQANKAQNRLDDDEFAAMLALKQGEQATQLAGYQPAQRAKVATKTFMGELTFIPGQDELTFSYLTVGPDGRRETRTVTFDELVDSKVVTNDDEGFARYREMTGAKDKATPRERRQFDRMFRPPLLGKGRQYRQRDRGSRRARVQAGDMTSEVETYEAEDFRPPEPVVEAPETTETPKDGGTAKQKTGGRGAKAGGAEIGPEGRALRAGSGAAGTGGDSGSNLPRTEAAAGELYAQKIQGADAVERGVAPGFADTDPLKVGDIPGVQVPYRFGENPEPVVGISSESQDKTSDDNSTGSKKSLAAGVTVDQEALIPRLMEAVPSYFAKFMEVNDERTLEEGAAQEALRAAQEATQRSATIRPK